MSNPVDNQLLNRVQTQRPNRSDFLLLARVSNHICSQRENLPSNLLQILLHSQIRSPPNNHPLNRLLRPPVHPVNQPAHLHVNQYANQRISQLRHLHINLRANPFYALLVSLRVSHHLDQAVNRVCSLYPHPVPTPQGSHLPIQLPNHPNNLLYNLRHSLLALPRNNLHLSPLHSQLPNP